MSYSLELEITEIINKLKTLTLLEAVELIQQIEDIFGVETNLAASSNVLPVENTQIIQETTQTEFSLILESVPSEEEKKKRLNIFRLIRELTSIGLKEAKELTSNLPQTLKESLSQNEAKDIKNQFEEMGAQIKII
uniref:Large ribosomal subunit protein bL12c n=1 Tax=Codium simulans TaxID=589376 RepID=A0A1I9LKG3_9CHLO|nr:50S ribosomal protein L12 [Codium simulans]ANJ70824.1 50S ribosomal protein L12 [Codium simulans]